MYTVHACLVCGEKERTIVCEYNRFVFMDDMWQSDMARFDYALCHGCGVVYATRRPERAEYDFLYAHFNEFLMRPARDRLFNVPELTPAKAEQIDSGFLPWWELRSAPVDGHQVRKMLRNDLANALAYLPHIIPNVSLEGAKVLHIRAKGPILGDFMKRVLGAAQVDLITLFPTHTYLAEKNGGLRAQSCLDYENFRIPFEETYDLIIENHILIHMLDPDKTLQVFASHLNKGGALFVQKELSDSQLFQKGKNLFAELRPFHYQQFDDRTLARMLRRYGFETVFLRDKGENEPELFGLARLEHEAGVCPRISKAELRARLDMYARWRDESILSLPRERCQALFGSELGQIWKRAEASGGLQQKKSGEPLALRRFAKAGVPDQQLEIGTAIGLGATHPNVKISAPKKSLADRLRRMSVGDWLANRLRGTRSGEWLKSKIRTKQTSSRGDRSHSRPG